MEQKDKRPYGHRERDKETKRKINPLTVTTSNDYIAGKGSVLKFYVFIMWLN